MKQTLISITIISFLFYSRVAKSQSNFAAFSIGPEFTTVTTHYFALDSVSSTIAVGGNNESVVGWSADIDFVRQWKSNLRIELGCEMRGFAQTFYFAIDSTPFYGPDYTFTPFRPYNIRFEALQMGPLIQAGYNFKISNHFRIIPETGFSIYFNLVNKRTEHYYIVDSTGIGDPGPYYDSYPSEIVFTAPYSLMLGCAFQCQINKKISAVLFPAVKFQDPFDDIDVFTDQTSWAIKIGFSYHL